MTKEEAPTVDFFLCRGRGPGVFWCSKGDERQLLIPSTPTQETEQPLTENVGPAHGPIAVKTHALFRRCARLSLVA